MKKTLLLLSTILCLTSCSFGHNDPRDKTIVVGASSTPHAVILERSREFIETQGYRLKIKVFDDYVTPNLALNSGDLDANFYQHRPFLKDFNEKNNTQLVSVGAIHFEPLGIYSKSDTLDNLKLIEKGEIAIPTDTTNKQRALDLLKANGVDIEKNNIIEVQAQAIPSILDDVDYAVINGNFALASKITDYMLCQESIDSKAGKTYENVIAVKEKNQYCEFVDVLLRSIKNDIVKEFINKEFKGTVIPVF